MSRAIFSFGRYNPPTVAHDALFKQMCYDSQVFRCSDVYFFVSQTQDKKRNPLSYQFKLDYLRKVYPQLNFIQDETIKTPFDAV
jgi:nicotinic acid mononucleotide adenylyltransferase